MDFEGSFGRPIVLSYNHPQHSVDYVQSPLTSFVEWFLDFLVDFCTVIPYVKTIIFMFLEDLQ